MMTMGVEAWADKCMSSRSVSWNALPPRIPSTRERRQDRNDAQARKILSTSAPLHLPADRAGVSRSERAAASRQRQLTYLGRNQRRDEMRSLYILRPPDVHPEAASAGSEKLRGGLVTYHPLRSG